ncbi:uncharacterized protein LOC112349666 isoform X2 [Selaginella moellendorffii]|uniref:uncharacterized protein LOC112349666 isoform X2 n=1 Tax=Selaginella moellendorffii TaxID=88036 RepID=UPI000D1CD373|nr:uncharacterized protein LOC112349666 isoform X2 [Selaginella moellendorffii]|eukprot:XP_024540246.1 uncharacterized protein LOC112349666 isoform X2 [Selaginella moellendorffii]
MVVFFLLLLLLLVGVFDEVSSSQKLRIVSTSSKVVSIDKNGSAILTNLKDGDDAQIWEQSFRLGRFQDAYGGFGFALMNERSGLYLRHGIAPKEVLWQLQKV